MAPAQSGRAEPDAASPDLCGSLFLRTSPRRSQADGREWRQAQEARGTDVGVDGLQRDRLPAYITWERYEANQQRLLQNSPRPGSPGVPRNGRALLTSLLVCGACGRRMYASYRSKSTAYYECTRRKNEGSTCCGLEAGVVDDLVAQQVLRALEPATLELSLKAIQDVHQERERLHRHWKQRLERAT